MKFVLDLNSSRDQVTRDYLEQGHELILTDDFLVEIFKSTNPVRMFVRNTETLRGFEDRVFACHDRGPLVRKELETGLPLRNDEIIDGISTTAIRQWIHEPIELERNISKLQEEALIRINHQRDYVLSFLREPSLNLKEVLGKEKSRTEYLRNREKRLADIKEITVELVNKSISTKSLGSVQNFKGCLSFTYAHSYTLLWRTVDWTLKNGIESMKIKKLTNDGFDMKYVENSVFFDGILTNEDWMKECRNDCIGSLA